MSAVIDVRSQVAGCGLSEQDGLNMISAQQETQQAHPSIWWPQFGKLYEALREACVSDASETVVSLDDLLTGSQAWLAQGLLGFRPPSATAKAQLENEESIQAQNGKKTPIMPSRKPLPLELSSYLVCAAVNIVKISRLKSLLTCMFHLFV